jgi:hypothetical protein
MHMGDRPTTFNQDARRRIASAVRRVERSPYGGGENGGATPRHECAKFLCKNTGTTWTKGTYRDLNIYSGSTQGSEADSGSTLTNIYNRMGDIGASKWVYVEDIGGRLEVWVPEC